MRLLLDTHVVLWQLSGDRELSQSALDAISDADDLLFSVVSFAEIGVKASVGKLVVPPDLQAKIAEAGVRSFGLSAAHGLAVATLPPHHRDPFDRLLIAQALTEGLTLISANASFAAYDIRVIAA